jgi:hypothetical protein
MARGLEDDVQGNDTYNLDDRVIMLDDMDDMSIFNIGQI